MKFKLLKIKKRTPKPVDTTNDLQPKGVARVVGKKLDFNVMAAKQLPSSKLYTNIGE